MKITRTKKAVDAYRHAHQDTHNRYPSLVPIFEQKATALMKPEPGEMIAHGEVVPALADNDCFHPAIRDTLLEPDTPAIDASLFRTELLERAEALETGIDAANSIQARNSIEKMLAHQMAACHVKAMSLIADSNKPARHLEEQQMQIKKINAATRLMDVFQKGMDTLSRTRNAGKQTIVVKQVHVTGGQNVIADNVTTGGVMGRGEVW